jgi:hypothetical protein
MGRQHQRDSGQKSTLTKRDHCSLRRIVLKNHRTTAAKLTAELDIYFKGPVSTKDVSYELHKSNIHGKATAAKPLITESNVQMCKRWCHDHNTWTSQQPDN